MKENREFDMLENANDNEVEFLAKIPVLTKKEKERMLKMSKNKLNKMNRESNIEKQVSGVEQYKRPRWYTFASAAASVVLVAGIAGTAIFLHRSDLTPEVTDNAPDSAVVEELFDKINELNLICSGGGVEVDESTPANYEVLYDETRNAVYYPVTDARFKTVEDVQDYFKQYVADPLETSKYHSYFVDVFSSPLFQTDENTDSFYFKKNDDAEMIAVNIELEKNDDGVVPVDIKLADEAEIKDIYEKGYDFSVPATVGDTSGTIHGRIVLEGGKWKMSEYTVDFLSDEENKESGTDNLAAYSALSNLVEFDKIINAGKVSVDEDDVKEVSIGDGYRSYYRVTDERFKKINDVKEYLSDSFTKSFLNENSYYIWDGNSSVFKEIDGKLYYTLAGKVEWLYFFGSPSIENETDDSFQISADSHGFYTVYIDKVKVSCVKEDGKWKIDKYEVTELSEELDDRSEF